jgi:hypothetical protein
MKIIIHIILFLFAFHISAQQQGQMQQPNKTIQGHVIDSITGKPLEYASVAAFRMRDSMLVSGAITNNKGFFAIPQITPGRYMLRVTFVGYKTTEFGPFMLTAQTDDVMDVGKINMPLSSASLNAVEIIGEKPFVEMNLDKKVVNIEGNVNITGGTAIDVLETVPSVTVDMDGNVSFRGSQNVTILIDGRPANFAGSRKAVLEQIPASMIESVELITNPSAKFDPEGTSGIINIVLKKRKTQNTSLITSLNANTNMGYSANVAINHGFKKVNVYGSYDFRRDRRIGEGFVKRYSFSGPVYYQEQISESESYSMGHSLKAGADYFLNSRNTLGFSVNANVFSSESESHNKNSEEDIYLSFIRNYRNDNTGDNSHRMLNGNVYYTKKFENPKQLLQLDLNLSNGDFISNTYQTRQSYDVDWLLIDTLGAWLEKIQSESKNYTILGKLDYTHPFGEVAKLETGSHVTIRTLKSDNFYFTGDDTFETLPLDPIRSSNFSFLENVFALYSNFSGKFGTNWSYSAGLRFEYAQADPKTPTDTMSYLNDYYSVYPTAALTRKIRDGEEIQITYGKRVNRPGFHSLSPFIDYSNSPNLRGGNPYLKPEYIHSFEIGYMKLWQKTSLMPSLFYKRTLDLISRYRINYLDSFSLATYRNIASADAFGLEVILNQTVTTWWRFNLSGSLFRTTINGENIDADLTTSDFSYSGNFNSSVKLYKSLDWQVNAMYRGPRIMLQGKRDGMFFVNTGLRYQAIENKLTLSLNLRDIFNTMQFKVFMEDDTFTFDIRRKWQSRVLTVGLTWQLNAKNGSTERSRRRGGDDGMNDDDMF